MRLGLRTLGVSFALHMAVLWAVMHWVPAPVPAPRRPPPASIAFVMPPKRPPVVAPTPPPAAPKPPQPSRGRVKTAARPAPVPRAEPETPPAVSEAAGQMEPAAPLGAQPPVDLFAGVDRVARGVPLPESATGSAAPAGRGQAGDPNAALQRATASLQALKHSLRGKRAAAVVPRGVQAFAERLNRSFVPDPNALRRASRLGIGTLSMLPHYFDPTERDQHGVRALARNQMGPPKGSDDTSAGGFTFGAGDGFDHDSATLRVGVVVHHDDQGKPCRWAIPKPSNDSQFDNAALASVRDAAETLPPWVDGVPRETHWTFQLQALRWGRMELLLDPGFIPPGREVEDSALGKTTVVQTVSLEWLALAEGPQAAPRDLPGEGHGKGSAKQPD